ncbi:LPS export ABC transporter permease LptG [Desulfospira joergensenii]|uniref:LPS export ABC transporter permease LptG n=1 Tax=Desulfospira joergensenii TaxID=53329 RepID=UPI0003B773E4|nr:LPS export ABC transporter permease LptG [Desulfospira joergensenii]
MTCLHRYWLKEFSKFFCIIQVLILVIFIFIDYLSRMDEFLKSDISLLRGLWYVLLKVPFMFVQLTPAGILLGAIAVFGLMNKNNELTTIRSSGISVYFLVKPALAAGFVLACLMFLLGETLIPVSMAKANHIRYFEIWKNEKISMGRKDIWIKSEKNLIHINYFDPASRTVSDITATRMGDDFKILDRIDAKKGVYEAGTWILENVMEQIYNPDSHEYDVKTVETKKIDLKIKPEDLGVMVKKSDEMSFFELRDYVAKVKNEGYDARSYQVDMHGKLAFPFICIIMALAGAATGMRSFAGTSMPAAIAVGVAISFVYWVMFGFCLSMGYAGALPPVVAAWITNLVSLCAGSLYLIHTE